VLYLREFAEYIRAGERHSSLWQREVGRDLKLRQVKIPLDPLLPKGEILKLLDVEILK
jgi:hypothetical protein